eukprot:GEMP01046428.1.p1 GENE.GEMP01046428.1~~GEMP01046428.1.p1  ORF type:complete len:202 (+),score=19.70 GEMP01046428.1:23-607(+)
MNAHTGEWHLLKATIRYSETGGSSLGVRFYLRHLLQKWKQRNPQTEVATAHSQWEHPELSCEFRNGERCAVSLRKLNSKQVEELLDLHRNSEGPNIHLRHGGPRVWTERRSIQGLWRPTMHGMIQALRPIKAGEKSRCGSKALRYSKHSLDLARQTYDGAGRWGSSHEHVKGLDRRVLRAVFDNPFAMAQQVAQ